MKKTVNLFAILSCAALVPNFAHADGHNGHHLKPYGADETPAATASAASGSIAFTGKGLNTPFNCCTQYEGQTGERDQPAQVHAPGSVVNHGQTQSFKVDPGYKNDDGNRLSEFRRANAVVANNEHTDPAKYGAGRDAATTGNPAGTGDTLGGSHFTAHSGHNQWVK